VKPVLQALVLAEHVYEDKSGKKIIAGTFNGINFRRTQPIREVEQPDGIKTQLIEGGAHGGSPYAYISLTDVLDNTSLELQFISLKRNKVVFRTGLIVRCPDRLATVELVVPLPPLIVPETGTYAFEIMCEGEVIGSHRIVANEITDTD